MLLEKRISLRGSSVSSRIRKLCAFYRGCEVKCWTRIELFLACHPGRWRRSCAPSAVQLVSGRVLWEGVVKKQWGGGFPGWISVIHARAAASGVPSDKKPPSCRERREVSLFAGWFPCSPPSLQGIYRDQSCWAFF